MVWFPLDELDLLEFFGSEAVEKTPQEGYWCYEASDNAGVTLRFSFDQFINTVSTEILVAGNIVSSTSHDGAKVMDIRRGILSCGFESDDTEASVLIKIDPNISVKWLTMIKM